MRGEVTVTPVEVITTEVVTAIRGVILGATMTIEDPVGILELHLMDMIRGRLRHIQEATGIQHDDEL